MQIQSRQHVRIKSYELVLSDALLGIEVYSNYAGTAFMAFSGKRNKPDFHYSFPNSNHADKYVADWHQRLQASNAAKVTRKQERKSYVTFLHAGDVLVSSWGYDQTNIDYYQVMAVVGRQTVAIRPIATHRVEEKPMIGKCSPLPDQFTGPILRVRVDPRGYVKISRYECAKLKQPIATEPVLTFAPDTWTAYA